MSTTVRTLPESTNPFRKRWWLHCTLTFPDGTVDEWFMGPWRFGFFVRLVAVRVPAELQARSGLRSGLAGEALASYEAVAR